METRRRIMAGDRPPKIIFEIFSQLIDIPNGDDIIRLPNANQPSGHGRGGQLFDNLVGWF